MKVLHLALSCFYIDDYNYQENHLPRVDAKMGNEVLIIASTETFSKTADKSLTYLNPSSYFNTDNIRVIRLAYTNVLPHILAKKIRIYINLSIEIEKFSPDIIYFHGTSAYDIITVARYIKKNPKVKFIVDCHEDLNNSAKNIISYYLLHKLFYKQCFKRAERYITKLLYITSESLEYCVSVLGCDVSKLHFFPLGGDVVDINTVKKRSQKFRLDNNLSDDIIIISHTGKLDFDKKTDLLVSAFSKNNNPMLRLVIAGSINQKLYSEIRGAIEQDERIIFLDWLDTGSLNELLAATDLYMQPGTQSSTMNAALCSSCALALFPYNSHLDLLSDFPFYISNEDDIALLLDDIEVNYKSLFLKKNEAFDIAMKKLDYCESLKKIYL